MITAEKARELFKVETELQKLKRKINWNIKWNAKRGCLEEDVFLSIGEQKLLKDIILYYENLHYKVFLSPHNTAKIAISWEK